MKKNFLCIRYRDNRSKKEGHLAIPVKTIEDIEHIGGIFTIETREDTYKVHKNDFNTPEVRDIFFPCEDLDDL